MESTFSGMVLLFLFMPPPLGAGCITFSGCLSVRPSVWSLKYPLLTCTWVRRSTPPTMTFLPHVRPSVCPSVRRGFWAFARERMEEMEIFHADVSWPSRELLSLVNGHNLLIFIFLPATKQLYKWYFPSVRLSVTPFWLCSHHRIIMKLSEVITNDQRKVHAKGQGQRSKVKVTEVTTQLNRFWTVTPVWIHIWW